MKAIQCNGKQIDFVAETGTVSASQKYSETHVSSSNSINGMNARVHSEVITNHEFWLSTEDGREVPVKLFGVDIPLKEGQRVTVVMAHKPGADAGKWCLLVNHNARRYWKLLEGAEFVRYFELSGAFSIVKHLLLCGVIFLLACVAVGSVFTSTNMSNNSVFVVPIAASAIYFFWVPLALARKFRIIEAVVDDHLRGVAELALKTE